MPHSLQDSSLRAIALLIMLWLAPVSAGAQINIPGLGNIPGIGGGANCDEIYQEEAFYCPQVDCDSDAQLVERLDKYFGYVPPVNNKQALLNKQLHDYTVNDSTRSRGFGYRMNQPDPSTVNDRIVSEPAQDNRWRDACLTGRTKMDNDYTFGREMMADEEPWPGVEGSTPTLNRNDGINCLVPKNTERRSLLTYDEGWRFRMMCSGEDNLFRVKNDKTGAVTNLFESAFGCFAPLPKCNLSSDWRIDQRSWIGQAYFNFSQLWEASALRERLQASLSPSAFSYFDSLVSPQSTKPECKPAFWVRLMMDSCANQFIARKTMDPNYVFNESSISVGLSPRFCQPFRIEKIPANEEEYSVHAYLERSFKGLLLDDYMPWMKFDRFQNNAGNQAGEQYRQANWPERKITWPSNAQQDFRQDLSRFTGNPSINDYATYPVEKINDVAHPFSPRYDIAETVNGDVLSDRTLFYGQTHSEAKKGKGNKYKCVPKGKEKEGYWEFGCTVYCSAVTVDLLRFRYKDFRLCMGCQIDTNRKAFWEEYTNNRIYYNANYCTFDIDINTCVCTKNAQGDTICASCVAADAAKILYDACVLAHPNDSDVQCAQKKRSYERKQRKCTKCSTAMGCEYGKLADGTKVCGSCARAVVTCLNPASATECAKNTKACTVCSSDAKGEALERTRKRTNKLSKPKWGPTAMGDSWPVCSTRYDHEGDPKKCRQAKKKYGCDLQGIAGIGDPNIGHPAVDDARRCESMDMNNPSDPSRSICHKAAKPVYSVNFLKIRSRKGQFATAQAQGQFPTKVNQWRTRADEDPADGHGFREYFGNNRPYMRWWDTGKEAFQGGERPNYSCDWGNNDAIIGVGRDYNSIHGRRGQMCRYGGGAGIGGDCITPNQWKYGLHSDNTPIDKGRRFPSLAGTEWAELKMYQANCFRNAGLNCLCQYEKIFKDGSSEEAALSAMGGRATALVAEVSGAADDTKNRLSKADVFWPLSWRGYASTPALRDLPQTSPAISLNQQFPNLFAANRFSALSNPRAITLASLDNVKVGDMIIWPAGSHALPHVAYVLGTNNLQATGGDLANLSNGVRWIEIADANNGKFPDSCGNTSFLGQGAPRRLYASVAELPESVRNYMQEQLVGTFFCEDTYLSHCVERNWNGAWIYRPSLDDDRFLP